MRVAILTDNDFGKVNGVTTTLRAVLAHAPADVVPHVYTLADDTREVQGYSALAAQGMPIPFYGEMRMHLPPVARLRARLETDRMEAIHLTTPGPVGLVARRLAASLRLPLLGSYHTELGEYTTRLSGSRALGSGMHAYMRWLYGACDRVLVPSESTRRRLAQSGWPADRLRLWTRGVDADAFAPARRSAARRDGWQVSKHRPAILYAGRLSREKGLHLLPRLRALLLEYHLPHRFILCGDGPMRHTLEAALPDAVFTGTVPHDTMGEIMASADLFLFPSDTDTAGNVVLEAQAAGLPVIVTDHGGPCENMVDRATGYVCRAGSERDFCWRTASLLVDAQRRWVMSGEARAYAVGRQWRTAMQPLFASYRELVEVATEGAEPAHRVARRTAAHV